MARRAGVLRFGSSVGRSLSEFRGEDQRDDGRRGSAASRGYDRAWQRARLVHLRQISICQPSDRFDGKLVAARLVDHWYPHCGLRWLFDDQRFWVSMCSTWHSGEKQRLELRGELALDDAGSRLGLPRLAEVWPDRVGEWRAAMARRSGAR